MMEQNIQDIPFNPQRLGIHYFADTNHYGKKDIQRWLPKLRDLGVSWMTLQGLSSRAIPEFFLYEVQKAGIKTIVHLPLSLDDPPSAAELNSILQAYAKWGVQYVIFFDRPNLRSQWPLIGWTQRGLVERFLEIYMPLAQVAIDAGLCPVFPPLEPGGDYWDTAFLRAALEEMLERGEDLLIEKMGLSAYAWADEKILDWGIGGPERWPASLPYLTPESSQDQRGFRIFDWYNAISQASVGEELPLILLRAGDHCKRDQHTHEHSDRVVEMAKLVAANVVEGEANIRGVPGNVVACNFWLLSSDNESQEIKIAWFDALGNKQRVVDEWQAWKLGQPAPASNTQPHGAIQPSGIGGCQHYLLLPTYGWGAAEFHLNAIKPFVLKHQPTIGYSVDEALRAKKVTVVGSDHSFPKGTIENLKQSGCKVEHIQGDGTGIASSLVNR